MALHVVENETDAKHIQDTPPTQTQHQVENSEPESESSQSLKFEYSNNDASANNHNTPTRQINFGPKSLRRSVYAWVWSQTRLRRTERQTDMYRAAEMIRDTTLLDGIVLVGVAHLVLQVCVCVCVCVCHVCT